LSILKKLDEDDKTRQIKGIPMRKIIRKCKSEYKRLFRKIIPKKQVKELECIIETHWKKLKNVADIVNDHDDCQLNSYSINDCSNLKINKTHEIEYCFECLLEEEEEEKNVLNEDHFDLLVLNYGKEYKMNKLQLSNISIVFQFLFEGDKTVEKIYLNEISPQSFIIFQKLLNSRSDYEINNIILVARHENIQELLYFASKYQSKFLERCFQKPFLLQFWKKYTKISKKYCLKNLEIYLREYVLQNPMLVDEIFFQLDENIVIDICKNHIGNENPHFNVYDLYMKIFGYSKNKKNNKVIDCLLKIMSSRYEISDSHVQLPPISKKKLQTFIRSMYT